MNTAEQLDIYDPEEIEEEDEQRGPWKFSEAPAEIQELAIEQERKSEGYLDYQWWDCVYEDFEQQMEEKGIGIDYNYRTNSKGGTPCIYFSGFSSQGDGACFEGSIDDLDKFLNVHFKPTEYPAFRMMIQLGGGVNFRTTQSGSYSHEYSVSVSFEAENWEDLHGYDKDDLRYQVLQVTMETFDSEYEDFEKEATEIFRGYMRELYKTLEKEYDYLNSDEAILEHMEANDYTIDEEGDIV